MDRLSKRKFRIVCHGKVVRIPLEGDEILRVHGERTQGVVKTLMNSKVVEFRVDLVPGATPVAKSPYRLAPVFEQLQELQDEGLSRLVIFPVKEHQCCFVRELSQRAKFLESLALLLAWSSFEVRVGITEE
ncbi:hypothetical protein Tco_0086188 [Tanacetum coccineum]